jgi:hypothetical protein
LTLLAPYPDVPFDRAELAEALAYLTGGTATLDGGPSYTMLAGFLGGRPTVIRRSERPFREAFQLGRLAVEIRMESWLPTDTIRRAGFGRVTVARRHVLTVERGIGVVGFAQDGTAPQVEYASALLAPLPRFRVTLPSSNAGK